MSTNKEKGSAYNSRFGLLCVLIGGSVGTGNLWRFPRLVAEYGGGAFIVVMLVALMMIGIPLVYVENVAGRATRHSAPGAFRDMIGPKYTWMGTFATAAYFMMNSYYMVVLAWCVRYTYMSATKAYFGKDKAVLFDEVTNGDAGTFICWAAVLILLYLCIRKRAGLEKAAKFLMPSLLLILLVLVVYSVTRNGAVDGLKYAFNFDPNALIDSNVWLEAFTQVVWSLGPGTMLIVAVSKYTAKDDDIALNTKIQAFGDMSFALLGTICILPCIFAFASSSDEALALCQSGNNGLTFIGLTNMFESMPGGAIVGTLFFLALSFAAFSTVITVTTCFSNVLIDVGVKRKKAVAISVGAQAVVGIPSVLSQDFLSNQDTAWGFGLILGTIFIGFLARKFGTEKMRTKFINPVSDIKVGKSFNILAGTVAPLIILVVLVTWSIQSIGWDPQWWNPLKVSSLGTMLVQWAIVLAVSVGLNKTLNAKIKNKYFNGEEFGDIPEEVLNEQ